MNTSPILTAICGGIGAGKSVVSRILRAMGRKVYDCDAEARRIMDCDATIHARLNSMIHPQCVVGGKVDRRLISSIVFSDSESLARLNSIVHSAVIQDIERWSRENAAEPRLWVETAIPRSSGIIDMVDSIWHVTAPVELRVRRVMLRNNLPESEILARIDSQRDEENLPAAEILINDGLTPLLPQIHNLL